MASIYLKTPRGVLYHGDARDVLSSLPPNYVDLVVTSPPYWRKRIYHTEETVVIWGGSPLCSHEWELVDEEWRWWRCSKCGAHKGELGHEPSPELFAKHLADIFEPLKRVLKPTGNLFVVLDDTYQNKSLSLVPWIFALEMKKRGWIVREIPIWIKKVWYPKDRVMDGNAMPESVKDRLTHTYEPILRFCRSPKPYFNVENVRPSLKSSSLITWSFFSERENKGGNYKGMVYNKRFKYSQKVRETVSKYILHEGLAFNTRSLGARMLRALAEGKLDEKVLIRRAIKDVNGYLKKKLQEKGMTIKELAEITGIKETTLAHYFRTDPWGACLPSREAWEAMKPVLELEDYEKFIKEEHKLAYAILEQGAHPCDAIRINLRGFKGAHFAIFPPDIPDLLIRIACPPGGVVLDPFAGSGTTLEAAERLGRRWIGIEIVKDYCEIAKKRLEEVESLYVVSLDV